MGSCGIVDIYQGLELYQCRLMDPDNRVAIDFTLRKKKLKKLKNLKLLITTQLLQLRKNYPDLFIYGKYIPLKTPPQLIAFARKTKDQTVLFIAPRFFANSKKLKFLSIPPSLQIKKMENVLTNQHIVISNKKINLNEILKKYPFAVLLEKR